MPVSYSVDVLRHWSCKCDEGEALAFRSHLAMSGLDLPEVDTAWSVVANEPDVAGSDVAAWQHVVSACVKAEKDGVSGRGLAELNKVTNDLAIVVATLNAREAAGWAESIADVVSETNVTVADATDTVDKLQISEPQADSAIVEESTPEVPVVEQVSEPQSEVASE